MALLRQRQRRCTSPRGYHRVLKVARTLADLDGAGSVGRIHIAGALYIMATASRSRHRGFGAGGEKGAGGAPPSDRPVRRQRVSSEPGRAPGGRRGSQGEIGRGSSAA